MPLAMMINQSRYCVKLSTLGKRVKLLKAQHYYIVSPKTKLFVYSSTPTCMCRPSEHGSSLMREVLASLQATDLCRQVTAVCWLPHT